MTSYPDPQDTEIPAAWTDPAEFLKQFRPEGPWPLSSLSPDAKGRFKGKVFTDADKAGERAAVRNKTDNVYFAINPARPGWQGSKTRKADVVRIEWLWVDLDPAADADLEEERDRLFQLLTKKLPPEVPDPTFILDSGGGYWGFWKLADPIMLDGDDREAKIADFEARQVRLEGLFGADACHNIDRIARLPGTLNRPDAKKRERGRVEAQAKVVEWHPERVFDLSQFSKAPLNPQQMAKKPRKPAAVPAADAGDANEPLVMTEVESLNLPAAITLLIDHGRDPNDPHKYKSRSEAVWAVLCAMVRAGCSDKQIRGILLNPDLAISAHVLDQPHSVRYANRQIENAREQCTGEPSELEELNSQHALLTQHGGAVRVLCWDKSELDYSREVPVLQTVNDFKTRYLNRKVTIETSEGAKQVPLGKWWLEHPLRREYYGYRFLPGEPEEVDGYLNLWRGFAIDPKPGTWDLMQAHLKEVIADNNEEYFDYIVRWAAWAVQNPDKPAEVALVLKGGRGVGKGTFLRALKHLFGQHGLQVTSPMQLTGKFNAHLRDCCLLFADEAIAPGDKVAESVLKGLITEQELSIEGKGVNVVQVLNRLHIVMASNEDWVAPAGTAERRFAVFEVAAVHMQDQDYFSAINAEMQNGGLEAMLHDLLDMELGKWHPRQDIPDTDALAEQKVLSLRGFERVFQDMLQSGIIPVESWFDIDYPRVSTQALREYAQSRVKGGEITDTEVGNLLSRLGYTKCVKKRPRGYILPTLPKARQAWDRLKGRVVWDDVGDWQEAQEPGKPLRDAPVEWPDEYDYLGQKRILEEEVRLSIRQ
jgi:hypothetical protein